MTVTIGEKGAVTAITADASDPYPDYSQRFVLSYERNFLGKNDLDVTIDERGLLKSVAAETTSLIADALKNLAESVAFISAGAAVRADRATEEECTTPGTYVRFLEARPSSGGKVCGIQIEVERRGLDDPGMDANSTKRVSQGDGGASGIFYRQDRPYIVTARDVPTSPPGRTVKGAANQKPVPKDRQFLVYSPSESPVFYLPVRRTLFSNNKATLVFNAGVPTAYKQTTEGDVVALLKLPADVIGAYFGAIGQILQKRTAAADDQRKLLDAQTRHAITEVRLQACKEAIAAGKKTEEIKAACDVPQ